MFARTALVTKADEVDEEVDGFNQGTAFRKGSADSIKADPTTKEGRKQQRKQRKEEDIARRADVNTKMIRREALLEERCRTRLLPKLFAIEERNTTGEEDDDEDDGMGLGLAAISAVKSKRFDDEALDYVMTPGNDDSGSFDFEAGRQARHARRAAKEHERNEKKSRAAAAAASNKGQVVSKSRPMVAVAGGSSSSSSSLGKDFDYPMPEELLGKYGVSEEAFAMS